MAKKETVNQTYVHTFEPEWEYEGKKYKTLTFYYGRLTGLDMLKVEQEMMAGGTPSNATPENSKAYQIRIAARAGGIGSDALMALPLSEFNHLCLMTRAFLLGMGMPTPSGSGGNATNSPE